MDPSPQRIHHSNPIIYLFLMTGAKGGRFKKKKKNEKNVSFHISSKSFQLFVTRMGIF